MNVRILPIGIYYFLVLVVITLLLVTFSRHQMLLSTSDDGSFTYGTLASFIAGVILASMVFLLLRPRVDISPEIAQRVDDDGNTYYQFKFINNSFFAAFDVDLEAYICDEETATDNGEGANVNLTPVILTRGRWIYVARWRPTFKNTRYAPHCITVRTYHEGLPDLIKDKYTYLEFRITLKHAFSNLSSTYRQKFMSKKCVKEGKFKFGNSTKVNV